MAIVTPGSGRAELLAKHGIVIPSESFAQKLCHPAKRALQRFLKGFSKCPHCGDVGDVAMQGPRGEELCLRCGGDL